MPPRKKSRVTRATTTKWSKRKRSADETLTVGGSLNAAPEGETQ